MTQPPYPQPGEPPRTPPDGGHPQVGYPQPGGYPQQAPYPQHGGYPQPGAYPQPGGYPPQGAYPQPGGYPPAGYVGAPFGGGPLGTVAPARPRRLLVALTAVAVLAGGGTAYALLLRPEADPAPPAAGKPAASPKPAKVDPERLVLNQLRDAATAEESYFLDNNSYTTNVTALQAEGWEPHPDVTVTVISATTSRYCISVKHDRQAKLVVYYDSRVGKPAKQPCR